MSLDEYNLCPLDKDKQNQQLQKVRNEKREREEFLHWIMNDNVIIDWDENGNSRYIEINNSNEEVFNLWPIIKALFWCITMYVILILIITLLGGLSSDVGIIEFALHFWNIK